MAGFHSADASRPANDAVAVTPSDVTVIPVTRALYIGTGGTLVVHMAGNGAGPQAATATFTNVAAGIFPIQVDQVLSTGTTATGILALY